ncbi:hypothetical protein APSETT445_006190, partial [Aspergillus pseudonomiae]
MTEAPREHLADRIVIDPRKPKAKDRSLRDVADGTVLVGRICADLDGTSLLVVDVELLSPNGLSNSALRVILKATTQRKKRGFYEEKNAWLEPSGGKFEGGFVNEITANQELISPIALNAYQKISNNPPSDVVIPMSGFNVDGQ